MTAKPQPVPAITAKTAAGQCRASQQHTEHDKNDEGYGFDSVLADVCPGESDDLFHTSPPHSVEEVLQSVTAYLHIICTVGRHLMLTDNRTIGKKDHAGAAQGGLQNPVHGSRCPDF